MPWKDNPVVPFDVDGNMLRVTRRWQEYTMVPVEPFRSSLKFVGFKYYSSSMTVALQDFNGKEYPMFIDDFEKLVHRLDKGTTPVLSWGYDKRGSAYGIVVLDNQEEGV